MPKRPSYFATRFGLCRSVGHAWGRPQLTRDAEGLVVVRLHCAHCPTTRRDTLNPRSGALVTRRYQHPDGYLAKGIDARDRPSKDDYRAVWIGDLMTKSKRSNVTELRRAG